MGRESDMGFRFYGPGETLVEMADAAPMLASWDKRGAPGQVRLKAWLEEARRAVAPALEHPGPLFLHLEVGLPEGVPLLKHYDLENYLTPLVTALGPERFVLVEAEKREGGSSNLTLEVAQPAQEPGEGWTNLWKGVGDCLGPILGEYERAYHPMDDRIVQRVFPSTVLGPAPPSRWAGG